MRSWLEKHDLLVASLIGLGSFVLYLLTLSPGVEGGDPGEFQFVPYLLGIPHQTGYPLYVLLGRLWSTLPLGSVAYRMNLFSALFAALTVCLTYSLLRLLFVSPWGAIFAALSLGLSRLFWLWATMAGVRAMNAFFLALILWTAFNWQKRSSRKWFYLLAFVFGLSLTHHRTTILALPALLLFVLWVDCGILRSPRVIFSAMASAIAPLSLYLYIFVRGMSDPPFSALPLSGLRSLIDLVIAGGTVRSLNPLDWSAALPGLSRALVREFTPLGALLGVLGGPIFFGRERKGFIFSLLVIFSLLIFTFSYDIGEGQVQWGYLILIYVPFAIWIGMGVDGLMGLVEKRARGLYAVALVAMALVLAKQGHQSYREIDRLRHAPLDLYRQDLRGEQARRFAASSLSLVETGAVILSDWEQATPLLYYQLVERKRPDLIVHYPLDNWREWLARVPRQPIYITRHFPPLLGMRNLTAVGPLVRLQDNPSLTVPSDIIPLGANFEGEMELVGYLFMNGWERHRTQSLKAGDVLQVMLSWRALSGMERDYSISLRLLDEQGSLFGQVDSVNPVLSLYPTHLWSPGEVVGDYHEILLPQELPEGLYRLEILVYLNLGGGKFHNLVVAGSDPPTEWAIIGPFMVYR